MIDIRDELQGAIRDAIQGLEEGGDPHSAIEGAIDRTLEEHGFDLEEVKGAMQEVRVNPMNAMAMRGVGAMHFNASGSSPFDSGGAGELSSLLQGGSTEEDLLQSFLQQFRAGVNLDLDA